MTVKTLDGKLQKPHYTRPSGSDCREEGFVAEPESAVCLGLTRTNSQSILRNPGNYVSVSACFLCFLSHSVLPFCDALDGPRQPNK